MNIYEFNYFQKNKETNKTKQENKKCKNQFRSCFSTLTSAGQVLIFFLTFCERIFANDWLGISLGK